MTRGYNFGAGPATLPTEILQHAQKELLDWDDSGMSVMETSHRSPNFQELMQTAEANLRELIAIPDNYKVLFISMPARTEFSMVPMNLLADSEHGQYLVTGTWSKLAYQEAEKFGKGHCVASGAEDNFLKVPNQASWNLSDDAKYFYYTPNETITGLAIHQPPQVTMPLVADMTSCLLSEPCDVSKYGIIIAGAQKNIAPAGLHILIIREDLIGATKNIIPTMLDYQVHNDNDSLYATPASFTCYLASLMFKWVKAQGGVAEMKKRNVEKSSLLYDFIDSSSLYDCPIPVANRSIMNVAFTLKDGAMDATFLSQAAEQGLLALKGHRSVGGMRASIYNAMPLAGVKELIAFMDAFASKHG